MKQTCKQCGKEFELTQGEITFYESKGLDLPKRCRSCREANKAGKPKAAADADKTRETIATTKTASEAGWSIGKLAATGIASIAIVVAALFGGNMVLGTTTNQDPSTPAAANTVNATNTSSYHFRSSKLLNEHFEKHGKEMGFSDASAYESAAAAVITNPRSLHKTEKEDNDDVYYLESTGEFVVVSTDGYIRTYYYADRAYFDRQ